jgi:hypothetical protein
MNSIIKEYENIALSNFDILKLLNGKANIVLYPDLVKYSTIDEVLGQYGACVLLFMAKKNYGHWTAIFKRTDDSIEFFNPYGGFPDDSLKFIPCHFRKISNQLHPYLSLLMYNSPYNLSYNEFKFQEHKDNIRTCGRHCVVRLWNRNLDLYQYKKLLDQISDDNNINYDEIVTLLTT